MSIRSSQSLFHLFHLPFRFADPPLFKSSWSVSGRPEISAVVERSWEWICSYWILRISATTTFNGGLLRDFINFPEATERSQNVHSHGENQIPEDSPEPIVVQNVSSKIMD
ncbi:hypothetical protein Bca52824_027517 [Brassica carinata]|uniref:Uncharacterized protein n=1 Tax=Brassica carinata TaxID=52824 RepID=A0A8X7VAN0_BRACI|nr:hypothetical protein Bca52824_027517 [Brassica carinata]